MGEPGRGGGTMTLPRGNRPSIFSNNNGMPGSDAIRKRRQITAFRTEFPVCCHVATDGRGCRSFASRDCLLPRGNGGEWTSEWAAGGVQ